MIFYSSSICPNPFICIHITGSTDGQDFILQCPGQVISTFAAKYLATSRSIDALLGSQIVFHYRVILISTFFSIFEFQRCICFFCGILSLFFGRKIFCIAFYFCFRRKILRIHTCRLACHCHCKYNRQTIFHLFPLNHTLSPLSLLFLHTLPVP